MSFNKLISDLSRRLDGPILRSREKYQYGLVIDRKQEIDLHASACENYVDLIAPLACIENQLNADLCFDFMKKNNHVLISDNICFALNTHRDELCLRRTLFARDLNADMLWCELMNMFDVAQNWSALLMTKGATGLR